jgi:hypothetical protein
MLSGSPINNKWPDIYSFLQLAQGHEIQTKAMMMRLLGTPGQKRRKFSRPTGERHFRYIQMLNALMLRRPGPTIQLPQLEEHFRQFDLNRLAVPPLAATCTFFTAIFVKFHLTSPHMCSKRASTKV